MTLQKFERRQPPEMARLPWAHEIEATTCSGDLAVLGIVLAVLIAAIFGLLP